MGMVAYTYNSITRHQIQGQPGHVKTLSQLLLPKCLLPHKIGIGILFKNCFVGTILMMKSWFNINLSERLSPHKRTKAKLLDFLATF